MTQTPDDELIVVIAQEGYPPDGPYELRLENIRQGYFGGWKKYQWSWSYTSQPDTTFRTLTNTSLVRSNALGLLTALNAGKRPDGQLDLRSFIGKALLALTALKPNGHPAITAVKPATPGSTFVYQMQTKPTKERT